MTDYAELKRLAEEQCISSDLGMFEDHQLCENILALIADNERLSTACTRAEQVINAESKAAAIATGRANLLQAERDQLKAENEALRKRIDDMSPFKGAPLTGQDTKCLACGGYHYGMGGLPCPNMRVTAQTDLPETRSGQIGGAMGKGERP